MSMSLTIGILSYTLNDQLRLLTKKAISSYAPFAEVEISHMQAQTVTPAGENTPEQSHKDKEEYQWINQGSQS